MSKRTDTVHFEWAFVEEGAAWPEVEPLLPWPVGDSAPGVLRPGVERLAIPLLHLVVLLLVGLLTVASGAPGPRPDDPARLHRQIEIAFQREEWIWLQNDIPLFREWLDPQAPAEWRSDWSMAWGIPPDQRTTLGAHITGITVQGDLLLVQTVVDQPLIAWWRATPFRELRFYRRNPKGWMRTSPPADTGGDVHTIATPHLRFQFYEPDTAAILAIAGQVELAYLQLYQVLGRPLPATPITLTFVLMPDQAREFRVSEEPLRFASPRLLKTPAGLTDEEYTTHLVISHLADRALLERLGSASRLPVNRWRTMFWGAGGRLRIEVLGKRSPWQEEAEAFFRQTDWHERPLRLTDIDDRYTGLTAPREGYLWEYMAAESLVDYVVKRYGWEGVLALFSGFEQSIYWSKVIPTVFDQSAADLEANWNRYLAQTYGATPE